MGVRGLQSFLKDNRGSLCRSVLLEEVSDGSQKGTIPIVVDAWGIIFKLYLDSLPWTSGGEYLRFYRRVKALVKGWRRVGLEPMFVFDGAAPPAKHETLLRRFSENITTCQLFYTTSITSRSAPSFSRDSSGRLILPAFASHSFIFALSRLNVNTHFVPLGEADGACVLFAERLGAYVLGQDTDFIILTARAGERILGYCPLDMISWIEGEPKIPPTPPSEIKSNIYQPPGSRNRPTSTSNSAPPADSDGFATVQNRRHDPHTPRQSPLLPPTTYINPTLVLVNVTPQALRQRLRLPATHLPLFASLCGNDYTPPEAAFQFFEPGLNSTQKIEKAARVLREQLFSPNNSPKTKLSINGSANGSSGRSTPTIVSDPATQVVELVKRTIKKLCIYPFDTEQNLLDMVNIIVEAALEYALPHDMECCSNYPFCGELDPMGCRTHEQNHLEPKTAVQSYAAAQRRGLISSLTQGWLYPDRVYLWNVLEDPSMGSLRGSDGARAVRREAWTIVDQSLGGLRWPEPEMTDFDAQNQAAEVSEKNNEDDEDQLCEILGVKEDGDEGLDSEESHGDLLGNEWSAVNSNTTSPVSNGSDKSVSESTPARVLQEWIRQGSSSRVALTPLVLPIKSDATLPICLEPLEKRLHIYLAALHSDIPSVYNLPVDLQPLIAILRYCLFESSKSSSENKKWKKDEVISVLRAGLGTWGMWKREMDSEESESKSNKSLEGGVGVDGGILWPLLESRTSNIVALISATMADSHILAQSLLLLPEGGDDEDTSKVTHTHLLPFVFFSGIILHTFLSKKNQSNTHPQGIVGWKWGEREDELFDICWKGLIDSMEDNILGFGLGLGSTYESTNGLEVKVGNEKDIEVGRKKKKSAKKVQSFTGGKGNGSIGRFDVLGELDY